MNCFGVRAIVPTAILAVGALLASSSPASGADKPNDPKALSQIIDSEINAKLAAQNLTAVGRADDAAFLRRLYFDLHGTLPPADRAVAFLDSKAPNKRSKLIDDLLGDEQYGQNLGGIWFYRLVPLFDAKKNIETAHLKLWLAEQFNKNRPWDKLAYEIIAAKGSTVLESPATIPYLNSNVVLKPEEVTNLVTRLFLGANLQCAQCHRHPFAAWTKKDYWGTAAFFTKLVREGTGNSGIKGLGEGTPRKFEEPEGYIKVEPTFPDGESPKFGPGEPLRPAFAAWATSPKNPFFARCMVNRVWAQLFGLGLVNPLDDVRPTNEQCTHPELLQKLADAFVASDFDLKFLFRAVCESETYQRACKPGPDAETGEKFYGRKPVRVLTPLQMTSALKTLSVFKPQPNKKGEEVAFLKFFSIEGEEFDPLEYVRGIPPQLRLANAPALEAGRHALARSLEASGQTPAKFVEQAYLRILSRRPTAAETQKLTAYIQKAGGGTRAHEDVVWVLLNSSEFTLVR